MWLYLLYDKITNTYPVSPSPCKNISCNNKLVYYWTQKNNNVIFFSYRCCLFCCSTNNNRIWFHCYFRMWKSIMTAAGLLYTVINLANLTTLLIINRMTETLGTRVATCQIYSCMYVFLKMINKIIIIPFYIKKN